MDSNKISVFVRVIDSGSITQAAKCLKQPKSRVSRNIVALERELGVSLIYRTTRQLSPTEAGKKLYDRSRAHVYELEAAVQSLKDTSREVAGTLRISATDDMGSLLLPDLLVELKSSYPKLTFQVLLTNEVSDLVKEGIDLAIRVGSLEDTTLMARALGQVAFVLVASPSYLKANPKIESLKDLASHTALVFSVDNEDGFWILNGERVKVNFGVRSNNPKVIQTLAVAGQGIALLPEFLCVDGVKAGILKQVLKGYRTQSMPVHLVWPNQRELSPKVRVFVDLALKRLSRYF